MPADITHAYAADHQRCDRLLAEAEGVAAGRDWARIGVAAADLVAALERHFQFEEESLFPALTQAFAIAANPLEVMRSEHAQMRGLLADLRESIAGSDMDAYLGILETLHFVVQQHNYKEESVLYPMADGALRGRTDEFAAAIADV